MTVKNQSNFINLLSTRQNVFPTVVTDVQWWGVVDSSSEYELGGIDEAMSSASSFEENHSSSSGSLGTNSNVQTLEDLAKRENPYKKKQMMMKSCKSYACGLDNSKSFATNNSSKMISKKGSNKSVGSFSSLLGNKRNGFMSCSISPPILE
ncbi:hypothetical protein MKX03_015937 [Papaver bracteatum]|nr:hypothetical protein MKX03_015937 [Papaver bracteatum]